MDFVYRKDAVLANSADLNLDENPKDQLMQEQNPPPAFRFQYDNEGFSMSVPISSSSGGQLQ